MVSLAAKRHAAEHLQRTHYVSERRACKVLSLNRSTKRRRSGNQEQVALVSQIHALSEKYPRMGYRKIYDPLKADAWSMNARRYAWCASARGAKSCRNSESAAPWA